MKIFKNIIFTLGLLASIPAIAMELPPQKAEQDMTTLLGLPTDIKSYLLPFVLQGNQIEMEKAIFTLASTSKQLNKYVNNPQVMLSILNTVAEKSPYLAHAVALAERLQTKGITLPVMKHPSVANWIAKTKNSLVSGDAFFNAVRLEPEEIVTNHLLQRNIELNTSNAFHETALVFAIRYGRAKVVEKLLAAGADPRIQSKSGCNAVLEFTTPHTKAEIIANVIKAGANPNIPDNNGYTPLIVAIFNTRADLVKVLLDGGADPEMIGPDNKTALDWAIEKASGFCTLDVHKKCDAILMMLQEALAKKKQKFALKQAGKQ